MSTEAVQVRVEFAGADAVKIEEVRQYRGVKAYSELIRLLVTEQYNKLKEKSQAND